MDASIAITARLLPQPAAQGGGAAARELDCSRPWTKASPLEFLRSAAKSRSAGRQASEDESLRRQALIAFSIRVASAGLAYVSQVFFARLLGVEAFGVFSVAWTLAIVLGHVAPLGVAESALRFLPRYHLRGQHAAARGFIAMGGEVALIGGALFALAGALIVLAVPLGAFCVPILGMLACIMPFAYQHWLEGVARGLDRPGLALACPYLLRPVLMGAALAAAASLGHAGAASAMLAAFLATLATASLQAVLVHRAARQALGDGPAQPARRLWLEASLPLAGGMACDQGSYYANALALGLLRGPTEAAIYVAASKTLALASFAQYAINIVAGRRFAAAKADGGRSAIEALAASSTRLTILTSLAAVALVLLAGWPLLALFGKGFPGAYPALMILCVGAIAGAMSGQRVAILTMLGYQRGLLRISIATLVLALVANLVLASSLGVIGAALASVLAAGFRSLAVIWLAKVALASTPPRP